MKKIILIGILGLVFTACGQDIKTGSNLSFECHRPQPVPQPVPPPAPIPVPSQKPQPQQPQQPNKPFMQKPVDNCCPQPTPPPPVPPVPQKPQQPQQPQQPTGCYNFKDGRLVCSSAIVTLNYNCSGRTCGQTVCGQDCIWFG